MTDTTAELAAEALSQGAQKVLDVTATVLAVLNPGAAAFGFTAAEIIALIKGLVAGAPAIVEAFGYVKAAVTGGEQPTPGQLAALKSEVLAWNDQIQKDAAAKIGAT